MSAIQKATWCLALAAAGVAMARPWFQRGLPWDDYLTNPRLEECAARVGRLAEALRKSGNAVATGSPAQAPERIGAPSGAATGLQELLSMCDSLEERLAIRPRTVGLVGHLDTKWTLIDYLHSLQFYRRVIDDPDSSFADRARAYAVLGFLPCPQLHVDDGVRLRWLEDAQATSDDEEVMVAFTTLYTSITGGDEEMVAYCQLARHPSSSVRQNVIAALEMMKERPADVMVLLRHMAAFDPSWSVREKAMLAIR
jgi:hypothetical protein